MSILVAKHIKKMLSDSSLTDKVGDRIFLEGLSRETSYPYIIYSYSITPELGTKDGGMDNCQLLVSICSKDGDSSLELAQEVRRLLEFSNGDYDSFSVINTEFSSYRGGLNDGVYERELEFTIKTSY